MTHRGEIFVTYVRVCWMTGERRPRHPPTCRQRRHPRCGCSRGSPARYDRTQAGWLHPPCNPHCPVGCPRYRDQTRCLHRSPSQHLRSPTADTPPTQWRCLKRGNDLTERTTLATKSGLKHRDSFGKEK